MLRITLIIFSLSICLFANDKLSNLLSYSEEVAIIIVCSEKTGTGKRDIFRINKPSFQWYYNGKWYELNNSNNGAAKDWKIDFKHEKIKLYNYKTEWKRVINLKNMTASMTFPTGEKYLYKCNLKKV